MDNAGPPPPPNQPITFGYPQQQPLVMQICGMAPPAFFYAQASGALVPPTHGYHIPPQPGNYYPPLPYPAPNAASVETGELGLAVTEPGEEFGVALRQEGRHPCGGGIPTDSGPLTEGQPVVGVISDRDLVRKLIRNEG